MNVYETIKDGLQEDLRKARQYDAMKQELEIKLNDALVRLECILENNVQGYFLKGFNAGFDCSKRISTNEQRKSYKEYWNDFKINNGA